MIHNLGWVSRKVILVQTHNTSNSMRLDIEMHDLRAETTILQQKQLKEYSQNDSKKPSRLQNQLRTIPMSDDGTCNHVRLFKTIIIHYQVLSTNLTIINLVPSRLETMTLSEYNPFISGSKITIRLSSNDAK